MNNINLKNRVAVVTGGAQGFGLAIVKRFLSSGAKVIIWDKDKEILDKINNNLEVQKIVTDVTDYSSVENATKLSLSTNKILLALNLNFI